MNPHAAQPISFEALTRSLGNNRQLIMQMTRREVAGRYKGSVIGLLWSFLNPVLILMVYTFVFSVVFKALRGVVVMKAKPNCCRAICWHDCAQLVCLSAQPRAIPYIV